MTLALRKVVKVQSGGRIEIMAPELVEGSTAEVIVLVDLPGVNSPPALASLIGAAPGGFRTPAEADAFLLHERDAWSA